MPERGAVVAGWGAFVPERVVTNAELERVLETSDEWITTRTGIRERHWADPGTSTGDMAVHAGRAALRVAGLAQVDRVVLATTTPDYTCPATAPWVAHRLGLGTVPAHDVGAVCSGFVYALASARDAIVAGSADSALVVGADRFSGIVDRADRTTAVIFGDGAGAVVLVAGLTGAPGTVDRVLLGADGSCADHIVVRAGGSRYPVDAGTPPAERYFTMRGGEVFTAAVSRLAEVSAGALARAGWSVEDCDWLVAHQANRRILTAVARALGLPETKVVDDLGRYGNTSAASIPLALAHHAERFRRGDRIVVAAFGGGTTWGATTLTWPGDPAGSTSHTARSTSGRHTPDHHHHGSPSAGHARGEHHADSVTPAPAGRTQHD